MRRPSSPRTARCVAAAAKKEKHLLGAKRRQRQRPFARVWLACTREGGQRDLYDVGYTGEAPPLARRAQADSYRIDCSSMMRYIIHRICVGMGARRRLRHHRGRCWLPPLDGLREWVHYVRQQLT